VKAKLLIVIVCVQAEEHEILQFESLSEEHVYKNEWRASI
jgi:hypothetical protein